MKHATSQNWSPEQSAAVTVASSIIGPIIPPSIMLTIYAVNMNVSIGQLLVAGVRERDTLTVMRDAGAQEHVTG